jgi:preprotein translocase subunit YajC
MKLEQATKVQIAKNALLSLLLYILPIVLMFGTFAITGQRPWEKKQRQHKQQIASKSKSVNPQSQDND